CDLRRLIDRAGAKKRGGWKMMNEDAERRYSTGNRTRQDSRDRVSGQRRWRPQPRRGQSSRRRCRCTQKPTPGHSQVRKPTVTAQPTHNPSPSRCRGGSPVPEGASEYTQMCALSSVNPERVDDGGFRRPGEAAGSRLATATYQPDAVVAVVMCAS